MAYDVTILQIKSIEGFVHAKQVFSPGYSRETKNGPGQSGPGRFDDLLAAAKAAGQSVVNQNTSLACGRADSLDFNRVLTRH